ncbi:MAG: glycosyltransferase family 4 protein [Candidatus Dormibacteraeota bacterium]|nr:glycosyltransferase family 4 protein [Candidatus Dormibacteraeota bacterium]
MPGARRPLYIEAGAIRRGYLGGIAHTVDGLVRGLLGNEEFSRRYELRLLVPGLSSNARLAAAYPGARLVRVPLPQRGYHRWFALGSMPPVDLLLGAGVYVFPNFANLPLRRSASLTVVNDVVFAQHPDTVEATTRRWLAGNMRRWLSRTDLIVTPSEFTKREIETLFRPAARIEVIPWGIDHKAFHPLPADNVARVRRRYALPESYVLYVGNFEPRKNLERLVRAYASLSPAARDAHPLVLAGGGGWHRAPIDATVAEMRGQGVRIIEPAAYVEDADLPALYCGAVALAHPSLYEGFGLSLLQAMACGTPLIASKGSSIDELVGPAALRVDPWDERDIARALAEMLASEQRRTELAEQGMQRAAAYSWQHTAGLMFRLVEGVATAGTG